MDRTALDVTHLFNTTSATLKVYAASKESLLAKIKLFEDGGSSKLKVVTDFDYTITRLDGAKAILCT